MLTWASRKEVNPHDAKWVEPWMVEAAEFYLSRHPLKDDQVRRLSGILASYYRCRESVTFEAECERMDVSETEDVMLLLHQHGLAHFTMSYSLTKKALGFRVEMADLKRAIAELESKDINWNDRQTVQRFKAELDEVGEVGGDREE